MKTNKVNPLTAFRKLTEARQAKVKKSLKKAQDGIEMNDDMINKAGSKGKKPFNPMADAQRINMAAYTNNPQFEMANANAKNVEIARMEQMKKIRDAKISDSANAYRDSITNKPKSRTPMMDSLYPKKKGGSVKRKK